MGFFSELKQDLSQAVNELVPEEEKTDKITFAQASDQGISLEEMISMIDDIVPETELEEEPARESQEISVEEVLKEGIEKVVLEEEPEEEILEEVPEDETQEVDISELSLEDDLEVVEDSEIDPTEEILIEDVAISEPVTEIETVKESIEGDTKMDIFAGKTASDETSVITAGMVIKGDIITEGNLDIIGTVDGNMDVLGKLNITGNVTGDAKASEIFADGAHIQGEIISEGTVKIGANSVIIGNISAISAAIAGAVKGDIDVQGPVIVDAGAIVMGNIRSKSVQINNGAMIEGLCSQCYAENNPTDFFDKYSK